MLQDFTDGRHHGLCDLLKFNDNTHNVVYTLLLLYLFFHLPSAQMKAFLISVIV